MGELLVTIKYGGAEKILNATNIMHVHIERFNNFIGDKFGVVVEYFQIIRNGVTIDVDLQNIYTLYDFCFENGDTLLINNPHAKARPCDMVGNISVNFDFQGMSVNVWIKKEHKISDLYNIIRKENTFKNNFCLKYQGEILSYFSGYTAFDYGINKGSTIEICGELIQV